MSPSTDKSALRVSAVRAMRDNYIWLIGNSEYTVAIDPGEPNALLTALKNRKQKLCAILLTHKHLDHTGGVAAVTSKFPVPVYSSQIDAVDTTTNSVKEGDIITIPELDNLELQVMAVPGHTPGHVAFYVPKYQWLFCGDTLFGAGCGRISEGSAEELFNSLMRIIALPDDTLIYCGHEYTLSNLRFAKTLEPDNTAIDERMQAEAAKMRAGKPTMPTTVALEKLTNPFLRTNIPAVAARLQTLARMSGNTDLETFAAMRQWKDTYVG